MKGDSKRTKAAFLRRVTAAQESVRNLVRPGQSLADELIRERREEARREFDIEKPVKFQKANRRG